MSTVERAFDLGLLSPSTAGADWVVSDNAVGAALIDVERAYLRTLEIVGIAPEGLSGHVDGVRIAWADVASKASLGGNPVIPMLAELRSAVPPDVFPWVHRGATSQDILDTALMLIAHWARERILADLGATIAALARLADEHRGTIAAARTLAQHSTPTTWGLRAVTWLEGVLDARDDLAALELPAQLGGASGTLAALVALSDSATAARVPEVFASELGLVAARPWHTSRAPITRLGDALARTTSALGVVAADVITLGRTEIAEVAEPRADGRGGSSAMPQKQNPVLSVLIRSAALRAPGLQSTLQLCAALAVDERPDGAWHAEWPTLRELLRLTLGSAASSAELTGGLTIDVDRARANLGLTGDAILAERTALVGEPGEPQGYLGLSDALIDAALDRARR